MLNINNEITRIKRLNNIQKTDGCMHPDVYKIALKRLGLTQYEIYNHIEIHAEFWDETLKELEDKKQ